MTWLLVILLFWVGAGLAFVAYIAWALRCDTPFDDWVVRDVERYLREVEDAP